MARWGGSRYSPTTSRTLASNCGSVENLKGLGPPRLEVVLGPHPCHGVVADPQLVGQQPRRPVRDPEVLGGRRQRGGQDLSATVASDGLGSAWTGLVAQPGQ